METKASVRFKGGVAHYLIRGGATGLYHAYLLRYDGSPFEKPPNEVTIIRGIRQWAGSYNEDLLIIRLGEIIEELVLTASMNKDKNNPDSGR